MWHCLKLERWQGPPHITKVKQYEIVSSFRVSLFIQFVKVYNKIWLKCLPQNYIEHLSYHASPCKVYVWETLLHIWQVTCVGDSLGLRWCSLWVTMIHILWVHQVDCKEFQTQNSVLQDIIWILTHALIPFLYGKQKDGLTLYSIKASLWNTITKGLEMLVSSNCRRNRVGSSFFYNRWVTYLTYNILFVGSQLYLSLHYNEKKS